MGETSHANRNRWLDALRGVAILHVLVWHMATPIVQKHVPLAGRLLSLTWSGVDLFFVLSGFLIGGILLTNRGADNYFRIFYARRVLRILPLYLIALVVFFGFFGKPFAWYYVPLLQNLVWAGQDSFGPGAIAMTWSLAVEEQFYLCLPLLVALTPRRWFPWVILALVCTAPLVRIGCHLSGWSHAAYLLLPARMDLLLIGVLIAWARIEGKFDRLVRVARIAILPLGLAFVALALAQLSPVDLLMGTIGYSLIALFYGALLVLIAAQTVRLPVWLTPLAWAGLGAYSLYLFHQMVEAGVIHALGVTPLAIAATLAGCAAVAWLCWKVAEEPLSLWGHRHFRYRRSSVASTPDGGDGAAPMGATVG